VVQASGPIHLGRADGGSPVARTSVGSDSLTAALRAAGRDEHVRAVVLRVDSPGGSYVASDLIRREIQVLRESGTPVVASMASVAASGGYYIAMPAHAIVAEPATLTGSIGVVLTKFVIDGTLKKLGMNMEGVSQGKSAEMYSPIRPFSPEERARMVENMQATYDTFVEKAAQGRNTTPEKIDAIGQGRVWTGRQAKEIGLVDELGGLDRAVALAKQRAKIAQDAEVELVIYPPKKSFYDLMRDPLGASDQATTLASLLGFGNPKVIQALAAPLQVFRRGEPLALMPNVFIR
jgi:protease-4